MYEWLQVWFNDSNTFSCLSFLTPYLLLPNASMWVPCLDMFILLKSFKSDRLLPREGNSKFNPVFDIIGNFCKVGVTD